MSTQTLRQQLFRVKPVPRDGGETGSTLKRSIGLFQLTLIGVGGTIGTGIFFILSEAVPIAGPAVIWSFIIAGLVAGLSVLCYAELASSVPVSGSSYSYAYSTLGELPAMGVAACLLLEYGVSTAAVAVGWSQYVNQLINNLFGVELPHALLYAPEEGASSTCPPSSSSGSACCCSSAAPRTRSWRTPSWCSSRSRCCCSSWPWASRVGTRITSRTSRPSASQA